MTKAKYDFYEVVKVFSKKESLAKINGCEGAILGMAEENGNRKMGVSQATFYNWKKKYSGLDSSELRHLKRLEEENSQLKKAIADLTLDKQILKDVISQDVLKIFIKSVCFMKN